MTEVGLARRVVDHAETTLGPVDVLVANAAVLGLGSIADIDPVAWRRTIEIDLVAPMMWNQAAVAVMRPRRRGRIVNVTSVGSITRQPFGSAFCAAKAGLNQLTACLAGDVADDGIVVFALSPAAHTAMGRELYENDVMPDELGRRSHCIAPVPGRAVAASRSATSGGSLHASDDDGCLVLGDERVERRRDR